jgi:hypothetical protein
MAEGDLRDQIARIEADIEQLAPTLDGCRKAMDQVLHPRPVHFWCSRNGLQDADL